MDAVGAGLLAKLRSLAPVAVRAFDGAGEVRELAVPGGRKRWSAVMATIEARPWTRVDLLDGKGRVLGHHDNDATPEGIEDISAPPGMVQAKWYLELMLRAQDMALAHRAKEFTAIFAGVNQLMGLQVELCQEQIAWLRSQRDEAVELERARMQAIPPPSEDDTGELLKLLEASPKLMESLGPLLALVMRPKALPAPPQPPRPSSPPAAPQPPPPSSPPPAPGRRKRGK